MKKLHILFITVCCVAAIVSCRKTETPVKPETEPEQKEEKEEKEETKTVLYGSLGETTKTYLSPNADESQFDVYWEYQDCITIKNNTKDGAATFWTEEATGSKKTVPFTQKSGDPLKLENGDVIEAFYPAEIYGESLIWPSEQRYVVYSNTPAGAVGNNPMWAETSIISGTTEMQFYNLGGVIRFKLANPTAEFKVVKAMISADQPMSGKFRLDDITDSPAKKATIIEAGPGITITPENGVTISKTGEASFYFAVPEKTYTGVQITLVGDTGEKVTAKLGAGKTLVVKRAEVVRLKAEGITPSIEGSNCFIGEGNVPIVITAMGNAFNGTTALDGNNAKAVWKAIGTNANGCKIVWETKNTTEQVVPGSKTIIESATFADGVLTVIPTGTPGNALVAITDGANGTGNIVWSYHIWVPETEINRVAITNANGTFVFLDRNLGALKAANPNVTDNTKSIGLLYQWGRKDPLLSFVDFNHNNMMNMWSPSSNLIDKTSNNYNDILNSIKNPDKIIKVGSDSWVNLYQLWATSTTSHEYDFPTLCSKSIYDPCPSGYRVVPAYDFYLSMGKKSNASTTKNYNTINAETLYFPTHGYLSGGGSKYDAQLLLWTATSRGGITSWDIRYSNKKWNIGSGSDGQYACYSANVRCIRDTKSADNGYSLIDLDQEEINFFD